MGFEKNDIVTVGGAEYLVTSVRTRGVYGVKLSTVDGSGTAGAEFFLGSEEELGAAQEALELSAVTTADLEAKLLAISAVARVHETDPAPDADIAASLLGQVNAIAAEVDRRKAGDK